MGRGVFRKGASELRKTRGVVEMRRHLMRIAIIGVSGDKIPRIHLKGLYQSCVEKLKVHIQALLKEESKHPDDELVHLVSGGCSFADHMAVTLFLDGKADSLSLYLPCGWDDKGQRFAETEFYSYRHNPGKLLNNLHGTIGHECDHSVKEIQEAKDKGAVLDETSKGFHARNALVAKNCDAMIAMTFGISGPVDGGTKHTWDLFKGKKIHICLYDKT